MFLKNLPKEVNKICYLVELLLVATGNGKYIFNDELTDDDMQAILTNIKEQKSTTNNKVYQLIVNERNRRLEISTAAGDYDFCVAHGLTEALRAFDRT